MNELTAREKIAETLFNMVAQHRKDYKLSPMRTTWDKAEEHVKKLYRDWADRIFQCRGDKKAGERSENNH